MEAITPQAKMFVQSLRGSQPLIVIAFLIVQRAMTIKELEEITGLDNDTVRKALNGLKGKGLEMQRGAHGRQTWLLQSETLFSLPGIQNPKFSDSGATATTTIGRGKLTDREVAVVAGQSPKTSDSANAYELRKAREARRAEEDRQRRETFEEQTGIPLTKNLQICQLMGIGEPMASQISELHHVTPELIRDHVKSLQPGETLGLAIVRIRGNEMPRLWLEEIEKDGFPTYEEYTLQKQARSHGMSIDEWRSHLDEEEEGEND